MATKSKKDAKALNAELENALFSDVERCEMYFMQNWKKVLAVALIAVVAITAVFAVRRHLSAKARTAASNLSSAATAAELESAIAQHPQAPGADMARYRLAVLYLENKEYDKALKTVAPLADGRDAALRGKAGMVEAYALELSGKPAEAARKFALLSDRKELSVSTRAEAAYAAGRLLIDLGKKAEAKALLTKVAQLDIPAGSQSAGYWKESALELAGTLN